MVLGCSDVSFGANTSFQFFLFIIIIVFVVDAEEIPFHSIHLQGQVVYEQQGQLYVNGPITVQQSILIVFGVAVDENYVRDCFCSHSKSNCERNFTSDHD